MRARVYFSFDRENDLYRADGVILSVRSVVSLRDEFDPSYGDDHEAVIARIMHNLNDTSVTVVLIGSDTAECSWVNYELRLSVERGNGLLGIYIHDIRDRDGKPSERGPRPIVPGNVEFPSYDWDRDLRHFKREVKAAAARSRERKLFRPQYFPSLGW